MRSLSFEAIIYYIENEAYIILENTKVRTAALYLMKLALYHMANDMALALCTGTVMSKAV